MLHVWSKNEDQDKDERLRESSSIKLNRKGGGGVEDVKKNSNFIITKK